MSNFKAASETARGKGNYQGMNWIRQEKRLAIYLRDGLACAYCGASVENGAKLSLDHIVPHSEGGSNRETNLVTCCSRCNSSRGAREVKLFATGVAGYLNHGVTAEEILRHIEDCTARPLKTYKSEAQALITRRGSAARVLAEVSE